MVGQYSLLVILAVAGLGSAALITLAGTALFRRQSLSYFLITMAIGTLALRTFLGVVTVGGFMSSHIHHVLEHLLDVLVIGLLFAAVYAVRRFEPEPELDDNHFQNPDD